jgi:hypothetical protein
MDPRRHLRRWLAVAGVSAVAGVAAGGASGQSVHTLSVSASVSGCEGSGGAITCEVDASFGSISGAEYYTAKVTAPGGGAQSFGRVGPGSASLPVSWTGNGEYVVTISAWGSDPDEALARDSSG